MRDSDTTATHHARARRPSTPGAWTATVRVRFLQLMARGHTVGWICQQLGIHRSTAYKHRTQDVEFDHAWRVAEEFGVQCLEQHTRDLAVEGVERPVFYKGKQVGSYREYDSEMVRFLLRAKRPAIYRERADLLEGSISTA